MTVANIVEFINEASKKIMQLLMRPPKLIILLIITALIGAFIGLDVQQYFSLAHFQEWVGANSLFASLLYFVFYTFLAALSIPGAVAVTLVGGAVFGFWWGLILVSFASSIGALLAFLLSRTLFRAWVEEKFSAYIAVVNRGIEREGAFYLFSLRLIPVIPFFVINLVFGLTKMKPWTFYRVSQLGMLAGTAVYVNAGAQLGAVTELSLAGVVTPGIVGALLLLALFPYVARAVVGLWNQRQGVEREPLLIAWQ